MFKRGSTPTYVFRLAERFRSEINLLSANHVYVTFEQGKNELQKKDNQLELTADTITLSLTQTETLSFKKGTLSIEINITFNDGGRAISQTCEDMVVESVEDRELE